MATLPAWSRSSFFRSDRRIVKPSKNVAAVHSSREPGSQGFYHVPIHAPQCDR
jgi:hypothetical protein